MKVVSGKILLQLKISKQTNKNNKVKTTLFENHDL